jgi:hypothetical protein
MTPLPSASKPAAPPRPAASGGRCRWLRPWGVASGSYLLAGAACPCCGGPACPVGLGATLAFGGLAAGLAQLGRWGRVFAVRTKARLGRSH